MITVLIPGISREILPEKKRIFCRKKIGIVLEISL